MSAEDAQEVATEVGAAVSDAVNSEEAKQAAEAVKQAAEAVKQAAEAVAEGAADAAQKGAEGAKQAYDAAAPVVADAAQKGAEGATQAYNAAAPVVADAAQKGAEGATQAYNAAAPVVADAAQKGAEGATQAYNAAAPVVADAAQKGGELAKQGAQKTAAAASRGAKKAAPHVTAAGRRAQAAAKTGYRVATPVVHQLGDAATDVLSNIPPPDIHFDSAAAKSALMGGASMGMMAASAAATGCAAFAADILKLEIFRDFYQFLSIFFSSLKMPDSFNVFFGNVASLLSFGFTRMIGFFTSVQAAMNPILWFWVFLLLAIVCWIRLSCLMDTGKFAGLKMLSKKDKDKMNWKEINKTSMFKFKQVKYLLLALTTLYTPVTRNALQMALCAPKYAYASYECFDNKTNAKLRTFYLSPQEDNAVGTCIDGYNGSGVGNVFVPVPKPDRKLVLKMPAQFPVCYADNHVLFVGVAVVTLIFFSLAFPRLMGKVIDYEKPKPIDPDDPENPVFNPPPQTPDPTTGVFTPTPSYEAKKKLYDELHGKHVIFNDDGVLVEYTDEIFLLEVQKKSASPFTTMYKGFEMSWAKYKIFVMDLKLVQILFMTLATSELLSRKAFTSKMSAMFASIAAIATTGFFFIFVMQSKSLR